MDGFVCLSVCQTNVSVTQVRVENLTAVVPRGEGERGENEIQLPL